MFENICSLPLPNDLFAQALSPRDPVFAVGLSSGHVHCYKLPPPSAGDIAEEEEEEEEDDSAKSIRSSTGKRSSISSENGCGTVDVLWKTRRHKGSCRSLGFSIDGDQLYSAGTDGIVKVAKAETGTVEWKIAVPLDSDSDDIDSPTLIRALSPQTLLLATDSSALHLYDIRASGGGGARRPQSTYHPHDDYISSLTALPPSDASTSGFSKQWVTTGGSTLAVTDVRRGVLVRSEDQEEELLSSCFVGGLSSKGTNVGAKVVVGGASGVLTLWERGVWGDQDERIIVDKGQTGGESIDCLTTLPDGVGAGSTAIVAGMGHGLLAFVRIGPNKVVDVLKHDEIEGVVSVGFDVGGRMITGGGAVVKVWCEAGGQGVNDEEYQNGDAHEDSEKGDADASSGEDDDSNSDDDDVKKPPRKKRRKGKKSKRGIAAVHGPKSNGLSFNGLD